MARAAADAVEYHPPVLGGRILLAEPGLEIVQKVELQVVDNRGIDFVLPRFAVASRRWTDLVQLAVEYHPRRSHHAITFTRLRQVRIVDLQPQLFMHRPDHELPYGNRAAFGKERFHSQ